MFSVAFNWRENPVFLVFTFEWFSIQTNPKLVPSIQLQENDSAWEFTVFCRPSTWKRDFSESLLKKFMIFVTKKFEQTWVILLEELSSLTLKLTNNLWKCRNFYSTNPWFSQIKFAKMICNVNKLKRFFCFSKSKKNENSRNLYFSPYCNSSNVKICGKLQIPRVLHRVFILTLVELDFYPITYHLVTKFSVVTDWY